MSTGGLRSFGPGPATHRVTVAADRDEGKPPTDRGFKAGQRAARDFARKHQEQLDIRIALPGPVGQDIDWPDVLRTEGVDAVRSGIASAEASVPPTQNKPTGREPEARSP